MGRRSCAAVIPQLLCGRLWLSVMAASVLACSGSQEPAPRLAAAESERAQAELRKLEEQWELRSKISRQELRPDLERFLQAHEKDPSAQRARLMLAQIALQERRFGAVRELLGPLEQGGAGSSRDEAQVILAAVDNREGEHEKALARLQPLAGKLLSLEAREQYARERTSAAIAARRWRLVVSSMIAWLGDEELGSNETREWIQSAILNVPPPALARLLSDWSQEEVSSSELQGRQWLHRIIILHLSDEALRSQDARLARDLLERSPPWLRASESGDELAVLAALAQKEAQVTGRSVGIVLGGQTEIAKRRAVRVAAGLLRSLNESQQKGEPRIRFVAVEDRGSPAAALGTLNGLGATILVAGVEPRGAQAALTYAEERQVPLILFSEPEGKAPLGFGFVMAASVNAQQRAIESSAGDASPWRFVGTRENPCEFENGLPAVEKIPLANWREQGVRGVGVLGDFRCVAQVWQRLSQMAWSPAFSSGLEAAQGPHPQSPGLWSLGVGQFPQNLEKESDRVSERERKLVSGAAAQSILADDWYFLLGYDAGQLIRPALAELPETVATEKSEVMRRHRQARDALRSAKASLRTSDAKGFEGGSRIRRDLRAFQVDALQVAQP